MPTRLTRNQMPPANKPNPNAAHSSHENPTSVAIPAMIPHPRGIMKQSGSHRADRPVSCNLRRVTAGIIARYITGNRNAKVKNNCIRPNAPMKKPESDQSPNPGTCPGTIIDTKKTIAKNHQNS